MAPFRDVALRGSPGEREGFGIGSNLDLDIHH